MNRCQIVGNIGNEIVKNVTKKGTAVLNLSVATNDREKQDGKWEKVTTWHRVVVWGNTAQAVYDNLKKGDKIAVFGSIRTTEWEDKEGIHRSTKEIRAEHVEFISTKKHTSNQPEEGEATRFKKGPNGEDVPF